VDFCTGSGVQGIVALRYYAERATFVDLNPRSPKFVKLNLALNGLAHKADGVFHGNLYDALPQELLRPGTYDAILANPPFVPNPQGIASGAGAMFGDGGDTGEQVVAGIIQGAPRLLLPGGRLSFVSMAPNVEDMPKRIEEWYRSTAGDSATFRAFIFHGSPTPAERYLPTASEVETQRYRAALQAMGVRTLSEVVVVITIGGPSDGSPPAILADAAQADLWGNQPYLRGVVQKAAASAVPPMAPAAPAAALPFEAADDLGTASRAVPSPAPASPPAPPVAAIADLDAAAAEAAAAVAAAAAAKDAEEMGRPVESAREGNLPGFRKGFFPSYCSGPSSAWVPTARELEKLAR